MDKIIIDNRSDLTMAVCLRLVEKVMSNGKISNDGKQHSYCTTFNVYERAYMVTSDLNKKSKRFVIQNIKSNG